MVAAFLRSGGDMFDVGANFGLVTFGVLPLVENPKPGFHLFEANARIVPLLERSASEWPEFRFFINHCCVTDESGTSCHSLPGPSWGQGHISPEGEEVRNLTIDDYVRLHQVSRIGFLKVDVEGWEVRVLKGAKRTLETGVVQAGFIEVASPVLARAGTSAGELISAIDLAGFDIYFAGLANRSVGAIAGDWTIVDINGTALRFARASPLPQDFLQGDVLVIHRSNPLAPVVRNSISAKRH